MHTIRSWCRANAMLVISLLAAAATAFFVPPDSAYLGYYDLKTLSCLFSVLAVVGALRDLDVFSALSQRMVHTFSTVRGVCTALVIITMFGSMLLTNDTALLTFLPLGWFVLSVTGMRRISSKQAVVFNKKSVHRCFYIGNTAFYHHTVKSLNIRFGHFLCCNFAILIGE